jgi:flagellar M-ring protein FliF
VAEDITAAEDSSTARRLYLVGAVAVVVVLIAVFFVVRSCSTVTRGPAFVMIYSRLELKDAANVVAKLKELKIPYEIRENGASIAVPKSRSDEARLSLAQEGLPQGGSVGWEIFDESKLGATDFDRRVQFMRAISGELARTIRHIDAIEDARVQIVIPETRLFEATTAPVTASVLLRLKPGERLTGSQVNGIIHLVASSVENLKPENVTVVDIYGNILTPSRPVSSPVIAPPEVAAPEIEAAKEAELAKVRAKEEQLRIKEEELKKKEEALKTTAGKKPGTEKLLSEEELKQRIEEEKKPRVLTEEDKALLRLKIKKEIDDQLSSKAQMVINKFYPPNTAVVKVNVELGTPKIEYVPSEVSIKDAVEKELRLKAQEIVTIKKISAVVLVDKRFDLTTALKRDTYTSIAGAIGYDKKRGDKIILRRVPFLLAEAPIEKAPVKKEVAPSKGGVDLTNIKSSLKALYIKIKTDPMVSKILSKAFSFVKGKKNIGKPVAGVIAFLFVAYILRKIFKKRPEEEVSEEAEVMTPVMGRSGEVAGNLDEIRRMSAANPDRIANLLKNWLGEEAT